MVYGLKSVLQKPSLISWNLAAKAATAMVAKESEERSPS